MPYDRYFTGGRINPNGSYAELRDALEREAARMYGIPKDQMHADAGPRDWAERNKTMDGKTPDEIKFNFSQSKHPKMKEINPQDRWKPDRGDRENEVTVWSSGPELHPSEVWVHTGRRGRIGDIRIYGPDGRPENIGPTYQGPGQWNDPRDALRHFKRVQEAFDKLNRGELR